MAEEVWSEVFWRWRGRCGDAGGTGRGGGPQACLCLCPVSCVLCFVPKLCQCGIRLTCLTEQKYNHLAWLRTVYSVSLVGINVGTQEGRMPLSVTETQQEPAHSKASAKSTEAQK